MKPSCFRATFRLLQSTRFCLQQHCILGRTNETSFPSSLYCHSSGPVIIRHSWWCHKLRKLQNKLQRALRHNIQLTHHLSPRRSLFDLVDLLLKTRSSREEAQPDYHSPNTLLVASDVLWRSPSFQISATGGSVDRRSSYRGAYKHVGWFYISQLGTLIALTPLQRITVTQRLHMSTGEPSHGKPARKRISWLTSFYSYLTGWYFEKWGTQKAHESYLLSWCWHPRFLSWWQLVRIAVNIRVQHEYYSIHIYLERSLVHSCFIHVTRSITRVMSSQQYQTSEGGSTSRPSLLLSNILPIAQDGVTRFVWLLDA